MSSKYGFTPITREALMRLPLETQQHLMEAVVKKRPLDVLAQERGMTKIEMADFHLDALLSWRQKQEMLANGRPKNPLHPVSTAVPKVDPEFTPVASGLHQKLRHATRQVLRRH